MKQEFLDFLKALMEASPNITPSEDALQFIKIIEADEAIKEKSDEPSSKGKVILAFLQEHSETRIWKAKSIAEEIGWSSRGISGVLRKLVTDGFCEKIGKDPISYSLTEKGKNYIINEND